jgi:glyoxylase-like metal-dependent hydrolase (beta-lactamase superfamily II)
LFRQGCCALAAIVMTHGHFDHIGTLEELAEQWDASVLAN